MPLFLGFVYADHAEWDYETKTGFCKVCNEQFEKDPRCFKFSKTNLTLIFEVRVSHLMLAFNGLINLKYIVVFCILFVFNGFDILLL